MDILSKLYYLVKIITGRKGKLVWKQQRNISVFENFYVRKRNKFN